MISIPYRVISRAIVNTPPRQAIYNRITAPPQPQQLPNRKIAVRSRTHTIRHASSPTATHLRSRYRPLQGIDRNKFEHFARLRSITSQVRWQLNLLNCSPRGSSTKKPNAKSSGIRPPFISFLIKSKIRRTRKKVRWSRSWSNLRLSLP